MTHKLEVLQRCKTTKQLPLQSKLTVEICDRDAPDPRQRPEQTYRYLSQSYRLSSLLKMPTARSST